MLTSFVTDTQRATDSDRPASITESGCYSGVFRQVYTIETKNGAQIVCFYFCDEESGQTSFVDLCVVKTDGTPAFGMNILNALLVCMGVSQADAVPGTARTKSGEYIDTYRLKAIENRPVGVVLQKEWETYRSQTGELKDSYRMNLVKSFDPKTRRTASEIIAGREPKILESFVKNLKDRDRRNSAAQSATAAPAAAAAPAAGAAPQTPLDSYDDCPF